MQIKFSVTGQELQVTQETMAGDTINYLEAEAEFSPEWEGLSKWVHFMCRDQDYQVALEGDRITRDRGLDLSDGIWRVWLHGTASDGMRITTTVESLEVKHTGSMEGGPLPQIPPTAAEQIDQKARKAMEMAQSVRQDADAGKFQGKPGDRGPDGGYYSPSAAGSAIHFTGSKAGMPEVPDIPIPNSLPRLHQIDQFKSDGSVFVVDKTPGGESYHYSRMIVTATADDTWRDGAFQFHFDTEKHSWIFCYGALGKSQTIVFDIRKVDGFWFWDAWTGDNWAMNTYYSMGMNYRMGCPSDNDYIIRMSSNAEVPAGVTINIKGGV